MAAVAKVSAEEPPDGSEPEACCGCFGGGGARGGDGARGEAGGGGEGGTEMAMVGGSSVVVMPKRQRKLQNYLLDKFVESDAS